MRTAPIIAAITTLVAWGGAATPVPAAAHELQVAEPGSVQLDLGALIDARLIHGTLAGRGDAFDVSLVARDDTVQLLLPDREPERSLLADDMPTLRIDGELVASAGTERIVDDVTGLAYLQVASAPLDRAATIRVERRSQPVRVALLVAAEPEVFRTNDPRRVPRTLARLRQWYETPASGARQVADAPRAEGDVQRARRIAWFGAGIGLSGVLVAAWWVRRGRAASRRSGSPSAGDDRR